MKTAASQSGMRRTASPPVRCARRKNKRICFVLFSLVLVMTHLCVSIPASAVSVENLPTAKETGNNNTLLFIGLVMFFLLVLLLIALGLRREYRIKAAEKKKRDKSRVGLGGWLYIFGFRLIFGAIVGIGGPASFLMLRPTQLPQSVIPILLFLSSLAYGLSVASAVYFCKSKGRFRSLYIAADGVSFLTVLILLGGVSSQSTSQVTPFLLVFAPWVAVEGIFLLYLFLSKRVRNTFFLHAQSGQEQSSEAVSNETDQGEGTEHNPGLLIPQLANEGNAIVHTEPSAVPMDCAPCSADRPPYNNEAQYCKHCGCRISADSVFCRHCGQSLEEPFPDPPPLARAHRADRHKEAP